MSPSETEEIKRHFSVVAEALQTQIKLVAESVSQVDSKLDREIGSLRDEMRQGFAETQAMIKFSYAELDRRVSRLESSLGSLEDRIQKLEAR